MKRLIDAIHLVLCSLVFVAVAVDDAATHAGRRSATSSICARKSEHPGFCRFIAVQEA